MVPAACLRAQPGPCAPGSPAVSGRPAGAPGRSTRVAPEALPEAIARTTSPVTVSFSSSASVSPSRASRCSRSRSQARLSASRSSRATSVSMTRWVSSLYARSPCGPPPRYWGESLP